MDKKELEKIAEKLKNANVDLKNDNVQEIWDKLINSGQYIKTEDLFKQTNK